MSAKESHPVQEKVKDITSAPGPTDVNELRAYLSFCTKFLLYLAMLLAFGLSLLTAGGWWTETSQKACAFKDC